MGIGSYFVIVGYVSYIKLFTCMTTNMKILIRIIFSVLIAFWQIRVQCQSKQSWKLVMRYLR